MTSTIRRLRRCTTAGLASLGVASLVAAPAPAHIPGVGNGLAPTTNGPDLRTVQALGSDLGDGLAEQARFCFDSNLAKVVEGPAGAFFALQSYDAQRAMNPTSASRDTANENCAIASFAAGTDITQATVGEVAPGAVTDLQSRTTTLASEPVIGSVHTKFPGSTTGPDLLQVLVNTEAEGHSRATYSFDETLDPAPSTPYQASQFGFYNAIDRPVSAPAGTVSVSAASATVDFLANPQIATATRFFINPNAVQDRPQTFGFGGLPLATPSSPDVLNRSAPSATRPEMISATPIGAQDLKVVFNVPIQFTSASSAGFFAINDAGANPAAAISIGSGGEPTSVLVTFPGTLADDPGAIVRVYLAPATVTAIGGAATNLAAQAPTSTPNSVAGFTNGPDLLSVRVDAMTSRVTYTYDESVEDTPPPAAGALTASAVDGSPIAALGGVVVSGSTVTALFPPSVSSAVMFANPSGTVLDKTGVPNPHQSVSTELQKAPPPPPVVVVAPPPPPLPTPVVIAPRTPQRYRTSVTIHSRGRLYFGTVRSTRDACRRGRRVLLKRRGLKHGAALSASKGAYRIKRGRRLRGRVYVTVTARGVCRPGKSRLISG